MEEGKIISRRSFLKGSVAGAVGAGALTAGMGTGLFTPRKVHAAIGYLPYTTLDVDNVRRLAWEHYFLSGG